MGTLRDSDVPDRRSADPVCRRIKSDPVFPRILAGTGGGIYIPVQRGNHSSQRKTTGIQAGSQDIASFVAALGANLGMPACAGIWPTLLAVLAINIFDIPYSIGQYAFLIVLTLIVSIGTVGVPGTSTVTTTALFTAAGLPVEIIVLLVPISSVVDMMRTAANVTGAATAAVLVAKSEQLLDREVYDQKKSEDGLSGAAAVGESAR